MLQKRYLDYQAPVSSKLFNERWKDIILPGIYKGFILSPKLIPSTTSLNISPGKLVAPDGVVIEEIYPVTVDGIGYPEEEDTKQVWAIVCDYKWEEYDPGVSPVPVATYKALSGNTIGVGDDPDFESDGPELEDHQVLLGYVVTPYNIVDSYKGIREEDIFQDGVSRMALGEFIKNRDTSDGEIYRMGRLGVGGIPPSGCSIFAKDGVKVGDDFIPSELNDVITFGYLFDYLPGHDYWGRDNESNTVYYSGNVAIGRGEDFDEEYELDINGRVNIEGGQEGSSLVIGAPSDDSPTLTIDRQVGQASILSKSSIFSIEISPEHSGGEVRINSANDGDVKIAQGGGHVYVGDPTATDQDHLTVYGRSIVSDLISTGTATLNSVSISGGLEVASVSAGYGTVWAYVGRGGTSNNYPIFIHSQVPDRAVGFALLQTPTGNTAVNSYISGGTGSLWLRLNNKSFAILNYTESRVNVDGFDEPSIFTIGYYDGGPVSLRVNGQVRQVGKWGLRAGEGVSTGDAWIGSIRTNYGAGFGNYYLVRNHLRDYGSLTTYTSYGLYQGSSGDTILNSAPGQDVYIRLGYSENLCQFSMSEDESQSLIKFGSSYSGHPHRYNVAMTIHGSLTINRNDLDNNNLYVHGRAEFGRDLFVQRYLRSYTEVISPLYSTGENNLAWNSANILYNGETFIGFNSSLITFSKTPVSSVYRLSPYTGSGSLPGTGTIGDVRAFTYSGHVYLAVWKGDGYSYFKPYGEIIPGPE